MTKYGSLGQGLVFAEVTFLCDSFKHFKLLAAFRTDIQMVLDRVIVIDFDRLATGEFTQVMNWLSPRNVSSRWKIRTDVSCTTSSIQLPDRPFARHWEKMIRRNLS